jgi:hypothetical protein
MAKSIHLNEMKSNGKALSLTLAGYWEHWFASQESVHPSNNNLDEHGIWEKAVHIGVLVGEKSKA